MKSKEFIINIPINIKVDGDETPETIVKQDTDDSVESDSNDRDYSEPELQSNPVMVPPLQQEIELAKAEEGKHSPIIDELTADDSIGAQPEDETPGDTEQDLLIQRLKHLLSYNS